MSQRSGFRASGFRASVPKAAQNAQVEQVKTTGYLVPRHLRARYLERLVELLPRDHGDADVRRACLAARREVLQASERRALVEPRTDATAPP